MAAKVKLLATIAAAVALASTPSAKCQSSIQTNPSTAVTGGDAYYKGQGVPQSYARAAYWYEKAAKQGDADAPFNLGASYYNGPNPVRHRNSPATHDHRLKKYGLEPFVSKSALKAPSPVCA